jgi:hypothetical protein
MGNKFLHILQAIDLFGETLRPRVRQLWKLSSIDAFVRMALRSSPREYFMSLLLMSLFCKTARCPTSQALLAYHRWYLATNDHASVQSHLASCDFCSAELQLLNRYPGDAEEYSFVEMPSQLRRLAEDLLKRSTATISEFAERGGNRQLSH